MNIVVTGGAGFLGSHLCERLINDGHNVVCIDDFSTGRIQNLNNFIGHKNFRFIHHNIIYPEYSHINAMYLPDKIDQIYNLACPASPPHYQVDRVKTAKTCFLGALNLLDMAKSDGARLLQASTSEVYGDPLEHPQKESYWGNVNPNGPRSCYDEGKRIAETLLLDYQEQYGVDVRIARIFNTYGPRMRPDDGRVVSNFICQAIKDLPLTMYGNGFQTRSFCYVDDMIEGFVRLMNADNVKGPVNLGNPNEFTMIELASGIKELMPDIRQRVKFYPLPPDDPKIRKPDITRAKTLLDWEPKVQLKEGLAKTILYFKEELGRVD